MKKPQRQQPMGAKAVRGSDAARRLAALLLEAWSGVRSTQSASEAMGVAVTRFYQLEARALQMMVSAMEPRPRGRRRTPESELGKLKAEKQRLLRDVERFQSLYRTAQRTLGVVVAKPPDKGNNPAPGGKRKRGARKRARGQAVAAVLLRTAVTEEAREANDATTEQGLGPRGRLAGRPGEQVPAEGGPGDAVRGDVCGRGV
jgi:type II secretory pathway component PulJ